MRRHAAMYALIPSPPETDEKASPFAAVSVRAIRPVAPKHLIHSGRPHECFGDGNGETVSIGQIMGLLPAWPCLNDTLYPETDTRESHEYDGSSTTPGGVSGHALASYAPPRLSARSQ